MKIPFPDKYINEVVKIVPSLNDPKTSTIAEWQTLFPSVNWAFKQGVDILECTSEDYCKMLEASNQTFGDIQYKRYRSKIGKIL